MAEMAADIYANTSIQFHSVHSLKSAVNIIPIIYALCFFFSPHKSSSFSVQAQCFQLVSHVSDIRHTISLRRQCFRL